MTLSPRRCCSLNSQSRVAGRFWYSQVAIYYSADVIPHALIFPGAFTPTGLFHAGLQSSAWLYTFWHAGLPLAVIGYVLLRDADSATSMSEHSLIAVIGLSVAP